MDKNNLTIMRPMRYPWIFLIISSLVIIPGILSLFLNGLNLGIDFTGGTTIVWDQTTTPSKETIMQAFEAKEVEIKSIKNEDNKLTLLTSQIDSTLYSELMGQLSTPSAIKELSFETIGPSLGQELLEKTILGLLLASTLIMGYVAYKFRSLKYGVSAILAMIHDLTVVTGIFSIIGKYWGVQIDTLFVTALLTILSFSVHDTIVVYDRIRELKKRYGYLDFEEIVNRAVLETMGRSVNNSMTIIFMLLSMYLLGGDTTKWFIFALLIGTISGTYSSTFTAAPLIILWDKLEHKLKRR